MNETPDAIDDLLSDLHDATRELLMDLDDPDRLIGEYDADISIAAIHARLTRLDREALTAELLAYSLCPLHRCDYASCFDDDDPECAAIRTIHPGHDT